MTSIDTIWYVVLASMSVAYGMALLGVRAAKQHKVLHHSKWMIAACSLVGLWLVGYVAKQVIFGRDNFGGTSEEYWCYYVPVLILHTTLAIVTIGLGMTNLYTGLVRLRYGTGVGDMIAGVSRHRLLGQLMISTFSGTLLTAYVVYFMLFRWFPAT